MFRSSQLRLGLFTTKICIRLFVHLKYLGCGVDLSCVYGYCGVGNLLCVCLWILWERNDGKDNIVSFWLYYKLVIIHVSTTKVLSFDIYPSCYLYIYIKNNNSIVVCENYLFRVSWVRGGFVVCGYCGGRMMGGIIYVMGLLI